MVETLLFLCNRTIYVNAFSSYYRNKSKKVPSSSEYALIISILKYGNTMEDVKLYTPDFVCLVHVFKQQFSIFLEICVGKKVCENTCNVI